MKIWRDIKDFILSYYYPKRQYFLVSFPKTGRTWLMHMINQMKEQSNHILKKEKSYSMLLFEDNGHNEILLNLWNTNNIPVFTNKTAYYLYNFIYPSSPIEKKRVFILQ